MRGTVLNGAAGPQGTLVFLVPSGPVLSTATADAAGRFSLSGVTPGDYTVAARLVAPAGSTPQAFWGRTGISVQGQNLENLLIDLRPGTSIRGHLGVDGAASTLGDLSRVTLTLISVSPWRGVPLQARIAADGRFVIDAVTPGPYRVAVSAPATPGLARPWSLKSVVLNGRDSMDLPFELAPDEPLTDMVVTLTNLSQHLSGTILDETGRPRSDLSLLVFATDPRFWLPLSRRVRLVRPATDGFFEIADLPSGEYRMLAFGEAEPDDPTDPRFLEPLIVGAMPVTPAPGERKVQNLRTGR